MGPRMVFVKAQVQQENHSGRDARSALLPFALSVMVTNDCEYRNNLPAIHGDLMDSHALHASKDNRKFAQF
jgi:hypothetical protein